MATLRLKGCSLAKRILRLPYQNPNLSEPALGRAELEERLKKDKLLKATQLKQTRQENDRIRKEMGLTSGRGSAGFLSSSNPEPEVSLEQLAQVSQAVNLLRSGADLAKSFAMDEDALSKMPMAAQPEAIKATSPAISAPGPRVADGQGEPQPPGLAHG